MSVARHELLRNSNLVGGLVFEHKGQGKNLFLDDVAFGLLGLLLLHEIQAKAKAKAKVKAKAKAKAESKDS